MQGRIAVETHIQTYIAKQDWDRLAQQLEDYELEVCICFNAFDSKKFLYQFILDNCEIFKLCVNYYT
jgi:hypothetical protein